MMCKTSLCQIPTKPSSSSVTITSDVQVIAIANLVVKELLIQSIHPIIVSSNFLSKFCHIDSEFLRVQMVSFLYSVNIKAKLSL
jgi:hypothetical protein